MNKQMSNEIQEANEPLACVHQQAQLIYMLTNPRDAFRCHGHHSPNTVPFDMLGLRMVSY